MSCSPFSHLFSTISAHNHSNFTSPMDFVVIVLSGNQRRSLIIVLSAGHRSTTISPEEKAAVPEDTVLVLYEVGGNDHA
ncbi:unnamed protein product [Cuscuta europaea]|uniref:Uncharacterized protein n=1 Tax=Cuscuta europaea TaxID=41803 RepID=A0A9P0ZL72_CUSEU|nr:unnamed protein product [Cuscuta europaea]